MSEADSILFGRAELERAFTALGERLGRRGVVADILIVGGAAMALAYDAARVTRDVDTMFKPHGIVHEEALNRRCQSAPVWQAVIVIYPAQPINGYRQSQLHTVSAVVISRSQNTEYLLSTAV